MLSTALWLPIWRPPLLSAQVRGKTSSAVLLLPKAAGTIWHNWIWCIALLGQSPEPRADRVQVTITMYLRSWWKAHSRSRYSSRAQGASFCFWIKRIEISGKRSDLDWGSRIFFFKDIAASKGMNTLQLPATHLSNKCFSHHLPEGKNYLPVVWLCREVLGSHHEELQEIQQKTQRY